MRNGVVILHNIRSAHNVGSIFRTSDAVGVKKIYLIGYTPAPVDRFGRKRRDIAKVALGAEESVAWESAEDCFHIFKKLKDEGYTVVAVEQDERSLDLGEFRGSGKVAYVFGSETEGLPREVLSESDVILEIPMRGEKESLNVSVAVGIVLFQESD